jgi:hypothetical protein
MERPLSNFIYAALSLGKRSRSVTLSITTKRAGELFSDFIKSLENRYENYALKTSGSTLD